MTRKQLRARYRRILFFFARLLGELILWELVMPRVGLRMLVARSRRDRQREAAVRFRQLAIEMGGLMIKVGQFLSSRLDVLPREITHELAGLQDEVPAEPFPVIRAQAEAELAGSLSSHYEWFDEQPLAAASLGQAHRARLLQVHARDLGFVDVVVKVQRPNIEQIVEVDLEALRRVGGWLQRYQPIRRRADVLALVEEFAATSRLEIDYLAEGRNAERFASNFSHAPHVHVPEVVWDLTTPRVLTLEDVASMRLGDYEAIDAAGIDRAEVAQVLLETYMQQILDDGFFHADPHPGNIFVTPVGAGGWKLTFIDFGMVGTVPPNFRDGLREMLLAAVTQDGARLVRSFQMLEVVLPGADLQLIEIASMQAFDRFGNLSMRELRELDPAEMVGFGLHFEDLLRELPFQLPENLLLLGRAVAILSGMCVGLDPNFNIWSAITPHAKGLLDDEGGSFDAIIDEALRITRILRGWPMRVDRVLTQMERGQFHVQNPRLDVRVWGIERAVRTQSGVILLGSLLVSGAILRADEHSLSNLMFIASALGVMWLAVRRLRRG